MKLEQFLVESGYHRIPLASNGIGHFWTTGALNGRPIDILIDTGASVTVIRRDLVEEMGLEMVKLPQLGGGAGGITLEVFSLPTARLTLGEITPQTQGLLSLDMAHVNEGLALKGAQPVDAVLGVDVFAAQAAVIDYGSSSLFLKCKS